MSAYSVDAYSPERLDAYREFVRACFGRFAYQAQPDYLDWLYCRNPYGCGFDDFRIVTHEGERVVGCLHKLRFTLSTPTDDTPQTGVAIHNLMVHADHRKGVGFLLLREVIGKHKRFLVPGVIGELSQSYQRLGATRIDAFWGQKRLLPSPTQALKRLFNSPISDVVFTRLQTQSDRLGVEMLRDVTPALSTRVAQHGACYTVSDPYLSWRLFGTTNTSTLALLHRSSDACLLMTVGTRKGLPVARVFFCASSEPAPGLALLACAEQAARALGCAMLLVTSDTRGCPASLLAQAGISPKAVMPDTYFYAKSGDASLPITWPLLSDLGFEEMGFGE